MKRTKICGELRRKDESQRGVSNSFYEKSSPRL